jgi:hypothetical protein
VEALPPAGAACGSLVAGISRRCSCQSCEDEVPARWCGPAPYPKRLPKTPFPVLPRMELRPLRHAALAPSSAASARPRLRRPHPPAPLEGQSYPRWHAKSLPVMATSSCGTGHGRTCRPHYLGSRWQRPAGGRGNRRRCSHPLHHTRPAALPFPPPAHRHLHSEPAGLIDTGWMQCPGCRRRVTASVVASCHLPHLACQNPRLHHILPVLQPRKA